MSINPAAVDTPRIILAKHIVDDRGWFSETFRENWLDDIGIHLRFVQDNQSYSKRAGTLRGLHFQKPPAAQSKLVSVVRGRILDIAVDIRSGSPTFGNHVSTILSAASGRQVYIPIGFAHGFLTLEDDVSVMYKVSDYYAPAHDCGVRWDDPDIAFPWPSRFSDFIVSEKDRKLPLLRELNVPFVYNGNALGVSMIDDLGADSGVCE